jgi:hypothetical protein
MPRHSTLLLANHPGACICRQKRASAARPMSETNIDIIFTTAAHRLSARDVLRTENRARDWEWEDGCAKLPWRWPAVAWACRGRRVRLRVQIRTLGLGLDRARKLRVLASRFSPIGTMAPQKHGTACSVSPSSCHSMRTVNSYGWRWQIIVHLDQNVLMAIGKRGTR